MIKGMVTAIVLNYNAPFEMLDKCLSALARQDYQNLEIILADNGSTDTTVDEAEKKFSQIKVLRFGRNYGFAGGNNRAVEEAEGEYLLFLNNDAYCRPDAIGNMVEVIDGKRDVIGVAPKMMLAQDTNVFDSVGTYINAYGCASNMGIGQVDIGQYDVVEDVFGGCFGAALIRASAFAADVVGPMDSSYFMYYEDVDWCLRANIMGYRFLTAPKAVVIHEHSASTKKFAYKRKYFLIERNLLRTAMKNFSRARAAKVVIRRVLSHCINILKGPYRLTSMRIALTALWDFPLYYFIRRRPIQKKRKIADNSVFKLSYGERPFFNPVKYSPAYNLISLIAMYRRLYLVTGEAKFIKVISALEQLFQSKLRSDVTLVKTRLKEILVDAPPLIADFIEHIEEPDEEA